MLHQNTPGHADWVVTYRIEQPSDNCCHSMSVIEFFRGSREECVRIALAFGGGECDKVRTNHPWGVIIGPADAWDQFLEDEGG